jgi:hypothetical protein
MGLAMGALYPSLLDGGVVPPRLLSRLRRLVRWEYDGHIIYAEDQDVWDPLQWRSFRRQRLALGIDELPRA